MTKPTQSVTVSATATDRWVPLVCAIVVVTMYLGYYLANKALPGNNPAYPLGWWGWFDQGKYIQSAQALWNHVFSPAQNWFPLGYSLLGAPFTAFMPMHPFFFVDLVGLLVAFVAFQSFALQIKVERRWSAPLFGLSAMADPRLAKTWAVPWNTTVSASLIWLALAATATIINTDNANIDRWRRFRLGGLGIVLGAMPLVRPTDAIISALCGSALVIAEFGRRRVNWRDAVALVVGGLAILLPYALLYLRIYGFHESTYVVQSGRLGFAFSEFPWKAYVLMIDPRPWFPSGVSILARCPWVALGLAGIVPSILAARGPVRWCVTLLAAAISVYCFVFFSYIDLLPSGLWMYANVHYFQWVFPGVALFSFLFVRQLFGVDRRPALISALVTLLILSVHINAVPVTAKKPARMVQFEGVTGSWSDVYFGHEILKDSVGPLTNILSMRLLPYPQGVQAVALRRLFVGPVQLDSQHELAASKQNAAPLRWGERFTIGYPLWLPPYGRGALPPYH